MILQEAILQLNQTVVSIRGEVAYNINEQVVAYDLAAAETLVAANAYKELRAAAYPPFSDYLDGIVKGSAEQAQEYVDACLAVKERFPKPANGDIT
jgi:hypothetical protein